MVCKAIFLVPADSILRITAGAVYIRLEAVIAAETSAFKKAFYILGGCGLC